MNKNLFFYLFIFFLVTSCSSNAKLEQPQEPTSTPIPTSSPTPVPPTPTATPTPLPVSISIDNINQLIRTSFSTLDQSAYFSSQFTAQLKAYMTSDADKFAETQGDFSDSYFTNYQLLDNGELIGLLYQRACYSNGSTCVNNKSTPIAAIINISRQTTLWELKVWDGGSLNPILRELGMEDFVYQPKISFSSNGGSRTIEWNKENSTVLIPIYDLKVFVLKDAVSGENYNVIVPPATNGFWIGSLSPDENMFAWVEPGRNRNNDTLKIYNIQTETVEFQYQVENYASDMEWSNDGSLLAIGTSEGSVYILNIETMKIDRLLDKQSGLIETFVDVYHVDRRGVKRLKFSDDGNMLGFTLYNMKSNQERISKVVMYNLETMKEENSFDANFFGNGEIVWSNNGSFLVTVTDIGDDRIIFMSVDKVEEHPLSLDYGADTYYPQLSASALFFNEEQTQLTLAQSLFSQVALVTYEIRR
jgi:WD40 repeat protein